MARLVSDEIDKANLMREFVQATGEYVLKHGDCPNQEHFAYLDGKFYEWDKVPLELQDKVYDTDELVYNFYYHWLKHVKDTPELRNLGLYSESKFENLEEWIEKHYKLQ